MIMNQKLKDDDGNEVLLFPLEYLYISQEEHQEKALDFLGWSASGRITSAACYAPCSLECVYSGNDHNGIFWSQDKVHLADGTISNVSILVAHSDLDIPVVGKKYNQGSLFYHTGNYGQSTGDHLHLEIAKGHVKWDSTGTHLENPMSIYNGMYVNNTVLSNPLSFDWKNYKGGVVPVSFKKANFKWVLYANFLRNKR